jgi:hypothetical protein
MHAVIFQVDFVAGREDQQEAELDFLTGMMKSTPGFVHGTWMGDDRRGLSCLVFDSEEAARAVAGNAKTPPDGAVSLRSVDVLTVARDI